MPSLKCTRCGRGLKDPHSIEIGMGPTCARKMKGQIKMFTDEGEFADKPLDMPITEGIVLKRVGNRPGQVFTNVPHLATQHSPSGFEWGYWGSGPADLALNVIEVVLRRQQYDGETMKVWGEGQHCFTLAYELHQRFKEEFIAKVPEEGAVILFETVKDWIKSRTPAPESCSDCGNLTTFSWYNTPLCHDCAAKPEYQEE